MASEHDDHRIFRTEALEYQFRDSGSQGVLKASPVWSWSVLLVSSLLVIAAGLFLFFAEVDLPRQVEGVITDTGGSNGRAAVATVWLSEKDAGQLGALRRVGLTWNDTARNRAEAGEGEVLRLEPVRSASGEIRYRLQLRVVAPVAPQALAPAIPEGTRVNVLLAAQKLRLLSLMTGAGGAAEQ